MDPTIKAGLAGCAGALAVIGLIALIHMAPNPLVSNSMLPANAASADLHANLAASNCKGIGAPVINVVQDIKNDADSGQVGNYWGMDNFTRTIQVWKSAQGTYCASVKYEGSFKGISGQTSPGGTGILDGTEKGQFSGGYTGTISGTLVANPTWKTQGNIGTIDYSCDKNGSCPGYKNWSDVYFQAGYSFDQPWWGWIYRAGAGKVWVNAMSGNSGDII